VLLVNIYRIPSASPGPKPTKPKTTHQKKASLSSVLAKNLIAACVQILSTEYFRTGTVKKESTSGRKKVYLGYLPQIKRAVNNFFFS